MLGRNIHTWNPRQDEFLSFQGKMVQCGQPVTKWLVSSKASATPGLADWPSSMAAVDSARVSGLHECAGLILVL